MKNDAHQEAFLYQDYLFPSRIFALSALFPKIVKIMQFLIEHHLKMSIDTV